MFITRYLSGLWRPLLKISWCLGMHFMLGANLSAHLLKSIWAGLHQRKCRGRSGHVWTTWNGPSMKVKIRIFSESCLAAFSGWHDLILYTGLIYLRRLDQCLLWPEKFRWPLPNHPSEMFLWQDLQYNAWFGLVWNCGSPSHSQKNADSTLWVNGGIPSIAIVPVVPNKKGIMYFVQEGLLKSLIMVVYLNVVLSIEGLPN